MMYEAARKGKRGEKRKCTAPDSDMPEADVIEPEPGASEPKAKVARISEAPKTARASSGADGWNAGCGGWQCGGTLERTSGADVVMEDEQAAAYCAQEHVIRGNQVIRSSGTPCRACYAL